MREKSPKVIDKGDRYGTSKRSSLCISWCQIHHTDQVSLKTTSGLGRASILFETTYDMYSK